MEMNVRYMVVLGALLMTGTSPLIATSEEDAHRLTSEQAKVFAKNMLAQLPILQNVNHELIGLVQDLTYGKTPAQIVAALTQFYVKTEKPLAKAAIELARQKNYIGAALNIAQILLNALPANSPRAGEIQVWIADLNSALTCIEYVLLFIKNNPQLVAMVIK